MSERDTYHCDTCHTDYYEGDPCLCTPTRGPVFVVMVEDCDPYVFWHEDDANAYADAVGGYVNPRQDVIGRELATQMLEEERIICDPFAASMSKDADQ